MFIGKPEDTTQQTIILKWIFKKRHVLKWAGYIFLRMEPSRGFCDHGNELSGSIEYGESFG
jgi:hypothetical protein